ncbi:MAG: hypothetical protein SPI53_05005 [Erysipelotrichaceae bacterium]|nr:hypothetical protein [Erysipelotrichaceae bacterium]
MKSKSKMVPLFNQILSEHNIFSFIFDKITSDQDAFNLIKNTIDNFNVNNSFIEVISNID